MNIDDCVFADIVCLAKIIMAFKLVSDINPKTKKINISVDGTENCQYLYESSSITSENIEILTRHIFEDEECFVNYTRVDYNDIEKMKKYEYYYLLNLKEKYDNDKRGEEGIPDPYEVEILILSFKALKNYFNVLPKLKFSYLDKIFRHVLCSNSIDYSNYDETYNDAYISNDSIVFVFDRYDGILLDYIQSLINLKNDLNKILDNLKNGKPYIISNIYNSLYKSIYIKENIILCCVRGIKSNSDNYSIRKEKRLIKKRKIWKLW